MEPEPEIGDVVAAAGPEPEPEPDPGHLNRQSTADAVAELQARGYDVAIQLRSGGDVGGDVAATSVARPLTEASDRDMLTDPGYPPTQFTHEQWCAARDKLRALGEPYKTADDWRQRLFRASLAMNQMQHHYGDLLSHIANHGGLFCERAVHVFLRTAPGGQHDSLHNRINLVQVRGAEDGTNDTSATRQLRQHLHTLRTCRNRCDHDHLPDLRPSDKPDLVHAAYHVAMALIIAATPPPDAGWRDGTVATVARHKRFAFIKPQGATRREDNIKVEHNVPGFASLRGSVSIRYRIQLPEPADGPTTVMELRVAGADGPPLTGMPDEATGGAAAAPAPANKSKKKAKKTTWRDGTVKTIVAGKFAFIAPDTDPDGKGNVYVHGSLEDFACLAVGARMAYRAGPSAQKPGKLAAIEVRIQDGQDGRAQWPPEGAGEKQRRGESSGSDGNSKGGPDVAEGVPPE
jgi:hypothetical protein